MMEALYQALKALDSKTFQKFCFHLLKEKHQKLELKHVDGEAGDEGIDVFVGELYGKLTIWQSKAFPNGVKESQKAQIRKSLNTALKHFSPDFWILCLSIDMDTKARRWFERFKVSHESRVSISDLSASEIVNDLLHRRTLRNNFFPSVVIDVTELKRLVLKTGELSTEQLEKLNDANVEDFIERLKERDPRFRYEVVYDGDSGPPKPDSPIPPDLVMSVSDGLKKINLYSRDTATLQANPPRFGVSFTGTGVSKFELFLDTGIPQEFGSDEFQKFATDLPLLKDFPVVPEKLFVAPSPAITRKKRSVQVIFERTPTERVEYKLMDLSPLRFGRKEIAFAISRKNVPLRIEAASPTQLTPNAIVRINIHYEHSNYDVRELKKSFDALALLRPSGILRVIDIETDKPIIDAKAALPELEDKGTRYLKVLTDLVRIADRFRVNLKLPERVTMSDFDSIALLKSYMENGTLDLSKISASMMKSEENKDLVPDQLSGVKSWRFTHQRHDPLPTIFGTRIDTGPVAMDFEAEIENLPATIKAFRQASIGEGVEISFQPLHPVRISLLSGSADLALT